MGRQQISASVLRPVNKTPISYESNRKIGGDAPSRYLARIQAEKHVHLGDAEMDELLASRALSPELLRQGAFDAFVEDRRGRLSRLVEEAMGKPLVLIPEVGGYEGLEVTGSSAFSSP